MTRTTVGGWIFDETEWPILKILCPSSHTDDDFDAYLEQLSSYRGRGEPYVICYDTQDGRALPATQRKKQTDYVEMIKMKKPVLMLGFAAVAHNAVQRGVMTAIFWMQNSPWPMKVFGHTEPAMEWLKERLAEGGIEPR